LFRQIPDILDKRPVSTFTDTITLGMLGGVKITLISIESKGFFLKPCMGVKRTSFSEIISVGFPHLQIQSS